MGWITAKNWEVQGFSTTLSIFKKIRNEVVGASLATSK